MESSRSLSAGEKRRLSRLASDLVGWAEVSGRDYPWRGPDATTYHQVVVEVLLQRTTATAVSGFYFEFLEKYPSWEILARAQPSDLENFLRPLGLWRRRAQSLIGLARFAAANDGLFPADPSKHRNIPAVGQYVSNAIMVFQHSRQKPLLDVNMARVIERYLRPRVLADIRYDPWLQEAAHFLVRGSKPELVNWAVLDFAALVCKARSPCCPVCPVRSRCNYYRLQRSGTKYEQGSGAPKEAGPDGPKPKSMRPL